MKIIVLNAWSGKIYEPLLSFIRQYVEQIDVFCFQEINRATVRTRLANGTAPDIFGEISEILTDFNGFHSESQQLDDELKSMTYGLAMFVRKGLSVVDRGTYELFRLEEHPGIGLAAELRLWNRLLQYVTIKSNDQSVTIFNFHGMWTGGGKNDEPVRLEQSKRIKAFLAKHDGPRIICGDFNLNPNTHSLMMLEEGMKNLIKEFHITSTRSHFYKQFDQKHLHYADYILTSPEINVQEFKVLQEPVSDHLPLYLNFL
ncbi:endonuclease/exonuclease/phosphatase family protein [Candidatus Uhrbacteria bacterium]|nr:endonuclease/exonuclease/phosphatase family protein [Candidatus Uhrbacteria bacterium]